MACLPPVDQQETAFLTALQATATWSLTNGVLTLFDANGAIQTTFTAPVTPAGGPLAPGVEWRIQSYNNGKGGVVTVLPDAVATATFEDSGMVSGNTGCNGFLGSYTTEGTSISFGPLATTRRACPSDASSAQEQAIIAAFGASASFEVVGERTTLRSADGATQLVVLRPSIQPTPG
jgi:heat shock protein HslJ